MICNIQPARSDHVPEIAAIWERGWQEAHAEIVPDALRRVRTSASFLARTEANLPVTRVAWLGTGMGGFCVVKGDELEQLYVAPQARGCGAAQALVAEAEQRIAAAGHQLAWLACGIGNTRAERFYARCNWRNVGRRIVPVETSEGPFDLEVWRFEKPLTPSGPS